MSQWTSSGDALQMCRYRAPQTPHNGDQAGKTSKRGYLPCSWVIRSYKQNASSPWNWPYWCWRNCIEWQDQLVRRWILVVEAAPYQQRSGKLDAHQCTLLQLCVLLDLWFEQGLLSSVEFSSSCLYWLQDSVVLLCMVMNLASCCTFKLLNLLCPSIVQANLRQMSKQILF